MEAAATTAVIPQLVVLWVTGTTTGIYLPGRAKVPKVLLLLLLHLLFVSILLPGLFGFFKLLPVGRDKK